jgi:WD40-like Beta Propeller Repeat
MRPKIFTFRNFLLVALASSIFGGLAYWGFKGFPLPFAAIPSTAGKFAFVWEKDGQSDIYLASPTGGEPERLSNDKSREAELDFSEDGQHLAFTAERGQSGVRQLCLTEAAPGRKTIVLTDTQSTKEFPKFQGESDIFFLDSGKVARTTMDASDKDAIFPTVEGKRDNINIELLFAEGGITQYATSPDGEIVLAAVKQERTQVLVVYVAKDKTLAVLGSARELKFAGQKDGSFVVLFNEGSPLNEALQLTAPAETVKEEARGQLQGLFGMLANQTEAMEGKSFLVHFDSGFKPKDVLPLPFAPSGFAVSPNNENVAILVSDGPEGTPLGLYVGNLANPQEPPQRLADKPVTAASWSADGAALAYVSEGELFVAPATGSENPTSITKGAGKASSPAWSPVKVKK